MMLKSYLESHLQMHFLDYQLQPIYLACFPPLLLLSNHAIDLQQLLPSLLLPQKHGDLNGMQLHVLCLQSHRTSPVYHPREFLLMDATNALYHLFQQYFPRLGLGNHMYQLHSNLCPRRNHKHFPHPLLLFLR